MNWVGKVTRDLPIFWSSRKRDTECWGLCTCILGVGVPVSALAAVTPHRGDIRRTNWDNNGKISANYAASKKLGQTGPQQLVVDLGILITSCKKQSFSLFSAGNLGGLASVGLPAVGRSLSTGGNWGNTVGLTIVLVFFGFIWKRIGLFWTYFVALTLAEISHCHICRFAGLTTHY